MEKTAIKKIKKTKITKKAVKPVSDLEEKEEVKEAAKGGRYFQAVGRRKTASARVRLFTQGEKDFIVNEKPYQQYFLTKELQQIAISALEKMNSLERFKIIAKVKGGGIHAQAQAIRHGIS